jgi:hypothetical protein
MPRLISISTSLDDQTCAAENLSKILTELGYGHAFIGGFAWSLLGSERPTQMSAKYIHGVWPKLIFLSLGNTILIF